MTAFHSAAHVSKPIDTLELLKAIQAACSARSLGLSEAGERSGVGTRS